jgi:hypothetical protein
MILVALGMYSYDGTGYDRLQTCGRSSQLLCLCRTAPLIDAIEPDRSAHTPGPLCGVPSLTCEAEKMFIDC